MIRLLQPVGAAVALAFGLASLPALSATPPAKAAKPAAAKSAGAKPAKAAAAKEASAAKPSAKSARAARKAAPVAAAPALLIPDATPDQVAAAGMVYYGRYECEFNQTVQIDKSAKNAAYVDVVAGKSQWLMKPVLSSTGAVRLEDVRGETLMVQISSKSMLLNVKTARRIVDECISPSQRELIEAAKAAKAAELAAANAGQPGAAQPAAAPALLVAPGSLPSARPAPIAPAAPASGASMLPAAATPASPVSTSEAPPAVPALTATSAAGPAAVSGAATIK